MVKTTNQYNMLYTYFVCWWRSLNFTWEDVWSSSNCPPMSRSKILIG
jgi:hypothetical protein